MTNSVYVVYNIEADDLGTLEVFNNHADAKAYVEENKKNGIELKIWQRPLKNS